MSSYFQEYCLLGRLSLSFAKYSRDFLPTRDRTLAGGDLLTYKGTGDLYEKNPTSTRRGCLRKYEGCAFGEVVSIETLEDDLGLVVQFQCPTNASCLERHVYMDQLRALQGIVDQENTELGDYAHCTWFASPVSDYGSRGDLENGVLFFYFTGSEDWEDVDFTAWKNAIRPGLLVEVWVTMQRIDLLSGEGQKKRTPVKDYMLLATSLAVLKKADITRKGPGGQLSQESLQPGQSAYVRLASPLPPTLFYVSLGSLFTYKDTCPTWIEPPTDMRRGQLMTFEVGAFGEVDSIEALAGNDGVVVKFRCPAEASCLEKRMYARQLHTLQTVVDTENVELGEHTRLTWFASPAPGTPSNGVASDGAFFLNDPPQDYTLLTVRLEPLDRDELNADSGNATVGYCSHERAIARAARAREELVLKKDDERRNMIFLPGQTLWQILSYHALLALD
ncbi:hypothetical protein C8R47DRAFT_1231004 [Mycena vitilis]|nr:hypothetical protein C8R47DRAFT_1231004 [Mycena vitilis]